LQFVISWRHHRSFRDTAGVYIPASERFCAAASWRQLSGVVVDPEARDRRKAAVADAEHIRRPSTSTFASATLNKRFTASAEDMDTVPL
jgi:hypothetical protein